MKRRVTIRFAVVAGLALAVVACAPRLQPAGAPVAAPALDGERLVVADGATLPVRRWLPDGPPKAVIIGLHGFNDYANAFDRPAAYWAARGIATYAYDQRGFGRAPNRGIWAGVDTMVADARAMAELVRRRHPGVPLHLVGVSMGGAVAMLAITADGPPPADGAVLVAPAVWAWRHMGAVQRGALWLFAHTIPWYPLSGQGLRIQASDNIAMLRALGRDPLVIKQTRIDTIYGLVDLMEAAFDTAPRLTVPSLVLYGGKDEVIPDGPTRDMLRSLPRDAPVRVALYAKGFHMLLRDLGADSVLGDIVAWIGDRRSPLPSGADGAGQGLRAGR